MSGRGGGRGSEGGGRGQNRGGSYRGGHDTGKNERGGSSQRGGGGDRGGSRGRGGSHGGPGRGGGSGSSGRGRGQNHGGAPRGGHNPGGGKGSDNPMVEKAILEERVRQLERATNDVKSMVKNLSNSEGDKTQGHTKKPQRDGSKDRSKHKDTRGSQSVGNLSSAKHSHNKGPTYAKTQKDQKHNHGPNVFGHQGQIRGPILNAPRTQRPFANPPPYTGSFPVPPRHPGTFNRPPHPAPSYDSFHQERAPPYDTNMAHPIPTPLMQMSFTEPPPPYDAPSHPEMAKSDNVIGDSIAKALSCFRDQFTDAESLGLQVKMAPKYVIEFVKKREDVFGIMMDGKNVMIELCPKIKLCADYQTPKGCNSVGTCRQLHLCRYIILSNCRMGNKCQFGHSWETNQNKATLTHFLLNNVDRNILPGLVKKSVGVGLTPRICYYYNKGTCRKNDTHCNDLHICYIFANNAGICKKDGCSLHHNIMAPHCKVMLEKYGISTNDSPRDLLLKITESKQKGKDAISSDFSYDKSCKNSDNDARGGLSKQFENLMKIKDENSSDNESDCDSIDSIQSSTSTQGTKVKKNKKKKKKSKEKKSSENSQNSDSKENLTDKNTQDKNKNRNRVTCWSYHFQGDVDIVEICLYSMDDGVCTNEKKGCRYLHCKSTFHWQLQCDDHWFNLRNYQAKTIEDAFCDVSKETVILQPLDPSKLDDMGKNLLSIMGINSWIVNFKTMTIVSENNQLKVYKLRRISTRSSAVSESSKATIWEWYFKDEEDNWIKYGSVDTHGNKALVCDVSSDDIEKHYLKDSSNPMEFVNFSYKYQLDFNSWKQHNLSTGKEREVRRRPAKRHVYDDSLPSNWDAMSGSGTFTIVKLLENTEEYQEIFGNIMRSLPLSKIINIQRLQNPYLCKAFQNKQEEMSHYYSKAEMNIQKLFYGAKPENVTSICKDDFDWRIHDANIKQVYGKGTYFFNSCATAKQRCTKDDKGSCYLFIAEVILGTVTKSNKSDTHPPLNPATQRLYDTTLDNPEAPTTFVKYEKADYYPIYIIEIQ
ncbi:unnamed protein product [Meganyctiphanes norvegica]|uniref:Poly [ADP-ribose] polymerase 12 n=1 Tax=Meganyctiphanes norvegica TaxID=48144 RepID=A0AAV2QVE8_MEGNR